jgi:hypothetical protein
MISYNRLPNVTALHRAIAEPSRPYARIGDDANYLVNRLQSFSGLNIAASTVDELLHDVVHGPIHFLKMNIEGAERLAIQGMGETLRHTAIVCISCHDFLAASSGDPSLCTKQTIREFLTGNGFTLSSRTGPGLAAYLCDQVWAFNAELLARMAS